MSHPLQSINPRVCSLSMDDVPCPWPGFSFVTVVVSSTTAYSSCVSVAEEVCGTSGREHTTSFHGSATNGRILWYKYHFLAASIPGDLIGFGTSIGSVRSLLLKSWKKTSGSSGDTLANTIPGWSESNLKCTIK